jgi:peptidoglycan hydrolase CwlO-like protein
MSSLMRAMLSSPERREPPRLAAVVPAPERAVTPRRSTRPDPAETLTLVLDAGEAFETVQLQLLTVLQKAKSSLDEAEQERDQLRDEVAALAGEVEGWSRRACEAEATLEQAKQVLQTQQAMLEKAILREREAVKIAHLLEHRLRQG